MQEFIPVLLVEVSKAFLHRTADAAEERDLKLWTEKGKAIVVFKMVLSCYADKLQMPEYSGIFCSVAFVLTTYVCSFLSEQKYAFPVCLRNTGSSFSIYWLKTFPMDLCGVCRNDERLFIQFCYDPYCL